jgi:hypothetical protein
MSGSNPGANQHDLEHDRLGHIQKRHDSDIRRGSIGQKLSKHFDVALDEVAKLSVSRFTSYTGSPGDANREPKDLIGLSCYARFNQEDGYEQRLVVIAEVIVDNGDSFTFVPV